MGIGTFVTQPAHTASAPKSRVHISPGDLVLLAAIIALCIFGLLMLYSASTDFSLRTYKSPTYIFNKQLLWMLVGTLVAFILSRIDYHLWQKVAIPMMGVTLMLLVAVLVTGDQRLGAIRAFFGGSVQPSELAKLTTIIYLSVWLYSKREYLHDVQLALTPLAAILGIIGGLIYRQPDLSAAMTIFILGGLLFFLAGGDLKQIVLFCVVALAAGWLVVSISSTGQRAPGFLPGWFEGPAPIKRSCALVAGSNFQRQTFWRGHWGSQHQAHRLALRCH